ncbi:uncharacterized protein [Pseudorasbora parva]|uniref:uncharacterized protein n=1 Tax=Pseudorasbora parva TaxID=51549 RepID=UPI00351E8FB1
MQHSSDHVYSQICTEVNVLEEMVLDEKEFPKLPVTPNESPAAKKKTMKSVKISSNADVIGTLSQLINERSDCIEKLVSGNTERIDELSKKVDTAFAEIKEMENKMCKMEDRVFALEKTVIMLEQRMDEMESYSRRWNLRLYGVSEDKDENVRLQAIKICKAVLPEDPGRLSETIDIAHRLGKKSAADSRPRPIILQFTLRMIRNEIWKRAKTSAFLQANGLFFKEDFSKGDRERRSKLWPLVKQARDADKIKTKLCGVPGVPGCLEHTGVVTQLIREAKESKGDLATLWLDLANAYGSIPHKLVETALVKHHVPVKIRILIMDYYNNFSARVSSGQVTSSWHQLEKGIITGCTISVSLFSLAMNMIVKSAEVECRGPKSKSGTRQPPIRAFMDDLTVMTTSVPGCRWLLQGLERLISWARMSFKPAKSRSLVLKKGKVSDRFRFTLGETMIPSVTEKPAKSLGKFFDSSLKDSAAIKQTKCDLTTWLIAIDRSGLPGKFKTWIYQHGVLPRILWPLLVYEVPISTVEVLEKSISQFLRKWLGLPRSLSSIALYGHSTKLHLPLSGLSEEFKVTRSREVLMYRDSKDTKVAAAGILVKTGRKWQAQEAVTKAEARLRHKTLLGSVAMGRAGLGCFPKPRYDLARGKERRRLIQDEIRAEVEEERYTKMTSMSKQGAWTRWEHADPRRITWAELWKAEPFRIKFLVQSVYDVLPSPANLHTWGLVDTPECKLCQKRGTLEHILSSCSRALGEGRYRWRHDQVLKALADSICTAIQLSKTQAAPKQAITFIRAGQKEQFHRHSSTGGLLSTARDWQLQVDLGRQLKFPGNITVTSLRPDMVLTSESTKQVVILELTVPWEDRIEEAHERKRAKYAGLSSECRYNGWKTHCEPVEVGCRGFAGHSLLRTLKLLGVKGLQLKKATTNILEAAERASRWLWIRRGDPWSNMPLGHKPGTDHPRLGRPGEGV